MKIAKIRGIDIKLHISTLFIILMVGLGAGQFYRGIVGAAASLLEVIMFGLVSGLLILFSILIHEIMHSITGQKYGQEVEEIELYLFGGAAKIKEEMKSPKAEMRIAAAGPLTSIAFGGLLVAFLYIPWNLPIFLAATFNYIGIANLILAAFNLIPAFPMDGGRILRAHLWRKRGDIVSATKTASTTGKVFGNILYGVGILEIFLLGSLGGIWSIIIGNFVKRSAERAYQQTKYLETLAHMKVRDLLGQLSWAIPASTSIEQAIRYYFAPYRRNYFPVRDEHGVIGIVHIKHVKNVPDHMTQHILVSQVMIPLHSMPSIDADMNAKTAFMEITSDEIPDHLLAVYDRDNHFVDVLDVNDFQAAIYYNRHFKNHRPSAPKASYGA